MYGLQPYQMAGAWEVKTIRMKASTTITKFDPVHLEFDATGDLDNVDLAAATETIYGVAFETKTSTASGGETMQILVGQDIVYKVDNDQDTNTFGDDRGNGMYFDIIGSTGAVQADTSSGSATTAAQIKCIASDNVEIGDTSIGLFKIHESQY